MIHTLVKIDHYIGISRQFGMHVVGGFYKLSAFVVKGHGSNDHAYKDLDCGFQFVAGVATKIEDAEPFFPLLFSPCMKEDTLEVALERSLVLNMCYCSNKAYRTTIWCHTGCVPVRRGYKHVHVLCAGCHL